MKNFVRGMGVGILVTTIVFSTAYMLVGRDISDSEIKERARKLGMVEEEQSILKEDAAQEETGSAAENEADAQETTTEQQPEQPVEEEVPAPEQPTVVEEQQPEQADASAAGQTDAGQNVGITQPVEGDATVEQLAGEKVSVTINRGQDGISVSRMLQETGVVADAIDFNRYLSDNKLQMNIMHGTFELEKNMDYAAIVQQIVWH